MPKIIIKNNIRKIVKELDEENIVNNVAGEVEEALEEKVREDLKRSISRVKANQRRTLFARDLWNKMVEKLLSEATRISSLVGDGAYCHYMRLAEKGDFDQIPERVQMSGFNDFRDGRYVATYLEEVRNYFVER